MPDLHAFRLVRPGTCFVPMYLRLAGFAEARPQCFNDAPDAALGPSHCCISWAGMAWEFHMSAPDLAPKALLLVVQVWTARLAARATAVNSVAPS